jgi:hypothetical protein
VEVDDDHDDLPATTSSIRWQQIGVKGYAITGVSQQF